MAEYQPPRIKSGNIGLLHREMGIPEGKTISVGELMLKKAKDKAKGNIPGLKRDVFAINARGWEH